MPELNLQYPIGKFASREKYTTEEIEEYITRIEDIPKKIDDAFRKFTPALLDKSYRSGGWTARQVLHHIADSHLNAYIRCKWALTEESPLIKAYNEKAWAETPETNLDPSLSVDLLKSLHAKWTALLRSLSPSALKKSFTHPETKKQVRLDQLIALYAWHGEHHLAHLNLILEGNK